MQYPFSSGDPFMPELLPYQFTLSTFTVWAIDLLKRSHWFPWLTKETTKLNTIAGVLGAALTAAGIRFVLQSSDVLAGEYVIHISGLTALGLWHFIKGFCISMATQQTILKLYQATAALQSIVWGKENSNGIAKLH